MAELVDYLNKNTQWRTKLSMIGLMDENHENIIVNKIKGSLSFLAYKQTPQNQFIIPLLEAQSLFAAGRLMVLSQNENDDIVNISYHKFLYTLLNIGLSYDAIQKYSIFSRIGATKTKIKQKEENDDKTKTEKGYNPKSFSAMMKEARKNNSCKEGSTFSVTSIFPPVYPAKFASGHGLPEIGYISLDCHNALEEYDQSLDIVVPLSLRVFIRVKDEPGLNNKFPEYV